MHLACPAYLGSRKDKSKVKVTFTVCSLWIPMLAAERQAHATATPAPSHTKAEPLLVVGHIQLRRDRLEDLGDRGVVLLGKLPRGHLVRLRRLHRHLLPRRVLQQLGNALALTYRIQQQQVPGVGKSVLVRKKGVYYRSTLSMY